MKKQYDFEKVVTRQGDGGKSSNYDGEYYSKDDLLFEALGNIDELSSWLGKIKHKFKNLSQLEGVQQMLQFAGSMLATNPRFNSNSEPTNTNYIKLTKVETKDIDVVEGWMKKLMESGITIENGFILPGKTPESADIDIARAVCRRAERSIVHYMIHQNGERYDLKPVSMLLNRLSDFLFILGRYVEQKK